MDLAYGRRWETDALATRSTRLGGTARDDALAAPSVGVQFGRQLPHGLLILASGRIPALIFGGQWAIGAGPGLETRIGQSGTSLSGLLQVGYAGLAYPFDEVSVDYHGVWTRGEVGARYRFLEPIRSAGLDTPANGFQRRLDGGFDVFVSLAVALDIVRAQYPANHQRNARADSGWRIGPDVSLGFGFLF